mgnify:CR=1 FL=1
MSDCAFAVMENNDVRYTSDTEPGRYEKGKKVTFTAEYIADNDNRMEVYANSTLLSFGFSTHILDRLEAPRNTLYS